MAAVHLRILHLEDDSVDAELVREILVADGLACDIRRVDSREGFEGALAAERFDAILCDYTIPSFSGREALLLAHRSHPEVPFIFVSGTIGEERASEAIRLGATDYVLKDHLPRLPLVVRRALREKSLEEQLRHSQKMDAIGTLAGGIAHDFNNLLTAILGYTEVLLAEVGEDSPLRSDLTEIERAARRASSLTRQLLAFSRKQVLEPRVVDLNSIVSEMEKMLRRLLGERVALKTRLEPGLDRVRADPGQLEQVVLNLVVNARDAMLSGGEVILTTSNEELDELSARDLADLAPGRYAVLSVSDTGGGMDAATRERIFDPFFTTKEKGTGLGLSTVYGIVTQSGGAIRVASDPGRGATFRLYFPRAG